MILTAEDPRSEDVDMIIEEISSGNVLYPYIKEKDRRKAIEKAFFLAQKGDWILILGKGHEQSMNFKWTEYPWSDIKTAKNLVN